VNIISIPTIFTAVDNFSSKVDGMSNKLTTFSEKASKYAEAGAKSALIGGAVLASLTMPVKAAIQFEDVMADVAKVTNTDIGSAAFNKLGDEAKELSGILAIMPDQAAGLMANLAQGGVATDDLRRVGEMAGKVGVAFGISADYAGDAFVKTQNALGGTIESTSDLMDVMNKLSDTSASSASEILTFMASGGSGAARQLGQAGKEMTAIGSAMISQGISANEAATAMQRFATVVQTTAKYNKDFKAAGGGAAGMMAILQKGSKLTGEAQTKYFQEFGALAAPKLQLLAKNFEQVQKSVGLATDAQATMNSVSKEFDNRAGTTAFQLSQMKAEAEVLSIEMGNTLLPVILKFLKWLKPIVERIIEFARENKGLIKSVMLTAGAFGLLMVVIGGILVPIAAVYQSIVTLMPLFSGIATIAKFLWFVITQLAFVFQVLWAVIVSVAEIIAGALGISLGWLVAIIAVIALAVWSLYENWQKIVSAFTNGGIVGGIKAIGVAIMDMILLPVQKILEIVDKLTGTNWASGLESFRNSAWEWTGATVEPTDTEGARSEAQAQQINANSTVNLNVNDPKGRMSVESATEGVAVKMGSTYGEQWAF